MYILSKLVRNDKIYNPKSVLGLVVAVALACVVCPLGAKLDVLFSTFFASTIPLKSASFIFKLRLQLVKLQYPIFAEIHFITITALTGYLIIVV